MEIFIILAVVVAALLLCLRIVPQASEHVIERLGKYCKTWDAGLHFFDSCN